MTVVLVDLRPLMAVLRVLDRERMEPELLGDERELRAPGVGDVEPAGMHGPKLGELIDRPVANGVPLFDEEARRHDRRICGRSGREATDDVHELARVVRLREIRLRVAAIGFATWIGDAGEDHERHPSEGHPQLARERRSVHAGHLHIQNDERGRIDLHCAQRLGAIACFDDAKTALDK
jgi:hypothetical protein